MWMRLCAMKIELRVSLSERTARLSQAYKGGGGGPVPWSDFCIPQSPHAEDYLLPACDGRHMQLLSLGTHSNGRTCHRYHVACNYRPAR